MSFYLLSNFLYSTVTAPPNVAGPGYLPPTLPLDGPGCVNALIKLTIQQLCFLYKLLGPNTVLLHDVRSCESRKALHSVNLVNFIDSKVHIVTLLIAGLVKTSE